MDLNEVGSRGLEIIVTRYMPWLFGKVPCTYITHNLRFFDEYQCEYIRLKSLPCMHSCEGSYFLESFWCGRFREISA